MIKHCLLVLLSVCLLKASAQTQDSSRVINFPEPRITNFIAPAALILSGAYLINHTDINLMLQDADEHIEGHAEFHQWSDNYIQFLPIVATGVMNLAGVKARNNLRGQTIQLIKTELILSALVIGTKSVTNVKRPDSGAPNSFPSGHTAEAFAGATFFMKEYGQGRPWLGPLVYSMAASVGVMRVMNNRHWTSDVLAGAGFGILSAEVAYLPLFTGKKKHHPVS